MKVEKTNRLPKKRTNIRRVKCDEGNELDKISLKSTESTLLIVCLLN